MVTRSPLGLNLEVVLRKPSRKKHFPWGGETEKQSSKIAGRRESETIDTEET